MEKRGLEEVKESGENGGEERELNGHLEKRNGYRWRDKRAMGF